MKKKEETIVRCVGCNRPFESGCVYPLPFRTMRICYNCDLTIFSTTLSRMRNMKPAVSHYIIQALCEIAHDELMNTEKRLSEVAYKEAKKEGLTK